MVDLLGSACFLKALDKIQYGALLLWRQCADFFDHILFDAQCHLELPTDLPLHVSKF